MEPLKSGWLSQNQEPPAYSATSDSYADVGISSTHRIRELSRLAVRGAFSLLLRSVTVQALTFGSTVLIARSLTPEVFGVFAILIFLTTFFTTFSDVGFGAALIQQHEPPSRADLTTTFTVQLILATSMVIVGFFVAPLISSLYHLGTNGAWLIRAAFASVSMGLLRTIPSLLLERQLAYGRLGLIEAGESLGFNGAAVMLVLTGHGAWSFVWALCLRGLLGIVMAYVIAPWRPGLGLAWATIRRLVRFGVPYQLQAIITLVKDSMTPTVLALILGATAVGYVTWAFTLATMPLLITSVLSRVAFPTFSRAQGDLTALKSLVEGSIRLSAIVFLPMSCLLVAAGPQIVLHIYSEQWLPALPSFYLFSFSLWSGPLLGASFFSLFYATNRSRVALYFVILYAILDWCVGLPLVFWLGFNAIAVRTVIVAYGTLPLLLWAVQKVIPIRPLPLIIRPVLVAIFAGGCEYLLLQILPGGLFTLMISSAMAGLGYVVAIIVLERDIISTTLQGILPDSLRDKELAKRYFSLA